MCLGFSGRLKSGGLLWKQDEPGGLDATDKRMVGSWSTPIVIKDQILCSMPTRVLACDPVPDRCSSVEPKTASLRPQDSLQTVNGREDEAPRTDPFETGVERAS